MNTEPSVESQTELRVGVKAFIKNNEGKYLLIKRSPIRYAFMKDRIKWEIPGGRMEADLTIYENLAKEIKEEVSLEILPTPVLLDAQDIMYVHKHKKQVVRLTFLAHSISNNVTIDSEEIAEFKWVSKEELMSEIDIDEYVKEVLEAKGHLL